MATITVEVQDKKLKFFKELLNQLSFVKIRESESTRDESTTMADFPDEDTDEQVIANIREGVRQMRLVEQGKMKSRPAREFFNDL